MLPICFTHGLALLSHYFKSSTCVCSVICSLQRRCMGVLCCYFRPNMFSPGDHVRYHSRRLGAHVLATVVGPLPNGLQFCHIRYIRPGGVTPVDHESAQLSRLEAVAVESVLASVEGTTVCLEIPLQSPPPGETITWRPSPTPTVARYPGSLQGGRGVVLPAPCPPLPSAMLCCSFHDIVACPSNLSKRQSSC